MATETFNEYKGVVDDRFFDRTADKLKVAQNIVTELGEYELADIPVNDTRHIQYIDRFQMPSANSGLRTKGFIFMTRPNLHLIATRQNESIDEETDNVNNKKTGYDFSGITDLKINPSLVPISPFSYVYNLGDNNSDTAKVNLGKRIIYSLMGITTRSKFRTEWNDMATPWLSVYSNTSYSYEVKETTLNTVNTGETFHGNAVTYGSPTFEHLVKGTVTINFRDYRDLSLYYTTKTWLEYINAVSYGKASPYRYYIANGILDYAASLYYIVTDETMENILYWEKLTGVFPISTPDSIFSKELGANAKTLEYPITFAYSRRTQLSVPHLEEINRLYFISDDYGNVNVESFGKDTSRQLRSIETTYESAYGKFTRNELVNQYQTMMGKTFDDPNIYKNTETFLRKYGIVSPTYTQKNLNFFANYLADKKMHGLAYVNGPYITMGSSTYANENDEIKDYTNNKSQYKLRWI